MDLGCGFDEILEVGAEKEVSKVDEFAVVLVLNIDETPSILTATNLLAIDNNVLLRTDHGEWDETLLSKVREHVLLLLVVAPRLTLICALMARSSSSNSSLS